MTHIVHERATSDRNKRPRVMLAADPSSSSDLSWGRARAKTHHPKRDKIIMRKENGSRESGVGSRFTKFHDVSLAEAVAIRNAGEVAEHVIATLIWLDESKPTICNGLERAHNLMVMACPRLRRSRLATGYPTRTIKLAPFQRPAMPLDLFGPPPPPPPPRSYRSRLRDRLLSRLS